MVVFKPFVRSVLVNSTGEKILVRETVVVLLFVWSMVSQFLLVLFHGDTVVPPLVTQGFTPK